MPESCSVKLAWHGILLFVLLLSPLSLSAVRAETSGISEYFIHEPVFGARVRMLEAGAPSNPLLVLVHGLNSSAAVWRPIIPSLARHFHVIAFDLPGFGQSTKANKLYSPDNYVAFIHYVVGLFPDRQIILVGHSLGGNIALRYAMSYSQQVNRLILVDAAGILHRLVYTEFLTHFGIRVLPQFYPQQKQDLKTITNELFGMLTEYSPLMDAGEQYILSQPDLRQQILGGYPSTIAAYAMIMTNYSRIMNHFTVPTLLLWGGRDFVAPLRIAHVLAANLDNAGLVVFPDAGHSPLHDVPVKLKRWIMKFASAAPEQRDAILAQRRYALPAKTDMTFHRKGSCKGRSDRVFEGDYHNITIDKCRGVQLRNVRVAHLVINQSTVKIDNCRLNSDATTLRVTQSTVSMTACHISGAPAIELAGSKLDIAGSRIQSRGDAIIAARMGANNTLLFSVSVLNSHARRTLEHGPVLLAPGDTL